MHRWRLEYYSSDRPDAGVDPAKYVGYIVAPTAADAMEILKAKRPGLIAFNNAAWMGKLDPSKPQDPDKIVEVKTWDDLSREFERD